MNRLASLIKFLLCFVPLFSEAFEEKPFVILMTSCDKQTLRSVLEQKYANYRLICIADGETTSIENYAQECNPHIRMTFIQRQNRSNLLACKVQAIFMCKTKEIVVDLNEGERLANENVLSILNDIYSSSNVWMALQHGKTFYAGLFHKIRKEDFLDKGQFLQNIGDLAYLLPISEMAGSHIDPVSHPLEKTSADFWIQHRKKYEPLDQFPTTDLSVYTKIADPLHPTHEDYYTIQNFLSYGERGNIERLVDTKETVKNMRIIGASPDELPHTGVIPVNCLESDRENCVVIYSSFNRSYPSSLRWLVNFIAKSDFKGHILYRIGGWPDTEGGSLSLAHVPYGFKVAFFKEARRMGFKRVQWLDTSIVPLVSLNTIFEMIQEKGYLMVGGGKPKSGDFVGYYIRPFMNAAAAAYFGLTLQETQRITSCSAGISGVDFTTEKGREIIERWSRAAEDPDAFFSARSDQNALSIILYQLGLQDFIDWGRIPHTEINDSISPGDIFLIDRGGQYRAAHP